MEGGIIKRLVKVEGVDGGAGYERARDRAVGDEEACRRPSGACKHDHIADHSGDRCTCTIDVESASRYAFHDIGRREEDVSNALQVSKFFEPLEM